MEAGFKYFYDTLIEHLETYSGEYEAFIDYGPVLFKVLCNLLNSDVDTSLRLPICGAIAYYVTPEDIIPENIYGPYGYVDDIYLSAYVLNMVAEKQGFEFIQEVSPVEDIEGVINECVIKSRELLNDEEIKSIIDYIGL